MPNAQCPTPNYQVAGVRALPADHGILVNSSAALREAIEALPLTAPVLIGFSALNRSRDALPPLIDAALASIAYYDETGDDSDMSSIGRATEELQLLLAQVENPPDDIALRAALATIEERTAAVPATQPHAAQLLALRAALDTLPPLPPRAALLDDLLDAAVAAPAVPALRSAWQALNESLLALPSLAAAQPDMLAYDSLQATLVSPSSAALKGAYALQKTLDAVPPLVAGGKPQPNPQAPSPNAPSPNSQCPMPDAQCPMPNAQCPMHNAQCPMPSPASLPNSAAPRR